MSNRILVINPNSNEQVTEAMDRALDPFRGENCPTIDCITLREGPLGIESQSDADAAAPLVYRTVYENEENADAFVIACYSDPGLRAARELTRKPVFGIAEAGLSTAIMLGGRIGVISILENAVERHFSYARSLSLDSRIVADVPIGLSVAELADEKIVTSKMLDVGRRLHRDFGADVIVLGCAGMARYRRALEDNIGVPVIDPTQAAVAAAVSALRLKILVSR